MCNKPYVYGYVAVIYCIAMKKTVKIMLLLAAVCLVACTQPTDAELLEGKWSLTRAYETVNSGSAAPVVNDLDGYVGQTMELAEDGTCCRTDRGEEWFCLWFLSADRHLVFADTADNHVLEDYAIDELTKERLVCGNSYSYFDSLTGVRTYYAYTFEYDKN